jgi:hypothetical protein
LHINCLPEFRTGAVRALSLYTSSCVIFRFFLPFQPKPLGQNAERYRIFDPQAQYCLKSKTVNQFRKDFLLFDMANRWHYKKTIHSHRRSGGDADKKTFYRGYVLGLRR